MTEYSYNLTILLMIIYKCYGAVSSAIYTHFRENVLANLRSCLHFRATRNLDFQGQSLLPLSAETPTFEVHLEEVE